MAYDAERAAKALLEWLQDDLADALDAVEGLWPSDLVTLPNPETWHQGYTLTVVELPSTSFPFLAVMVMERRPDRASSQAEWGFQERIVLLRVEYYVVASDEGVVSKICNRYAEAIIRLLQTHRVIEGFQQQDYEPEVHLTNVIRHPKAMEADLHDAADEDFIRGGAVEVRLEKG